MRIFSSASDAPNARRPTDLVLLVLAATGIVLLSLVAPGPTALGAAVAGVVKDLPGLFGWFWEICHDALLAWALLLVVVALFAHGRARLFLGQVLACVASVGVAVLSGAIAGTEWSDTIGAIWGSHAPSVYPASRLALAAAVIVTSSPHVSRPLRYVGRWVVFAGATASIALGIASSVGVLTGLLAGVASAALIHLLLGSPGGRLGVEQVGAALARLGVDAIAVRYSPLQPTGVSLIECQDAAGRPLLVKVYGRDAWDGQLIASTWSSVWRRGETPRLGGRLHQVEHEAFLTLFAQRAGVPVMPVVTAGMAEGPDALLVIDADGTPLGSLDEGSIDDVLLARVWTAVLDLHAVGIAHGHLDARRVLVRSDGSAALADFGDAEIAASELAMSTDLAQLLVTTSLLVGRERAVAAAAAALGGGSFAEILPCLQPAILDRETRRAIRERDWDVDDLLALSAEAAGVEPPELEKLRRVTWRSLLGVALIAFLAYVLIAALTQVGLQTLIDTFRSADAWYLLAALLLAPLAQVPQAFSTMGASIQPVRFGPVLMLQYAIQFIQLAVPSSAARIAVEIRFFQRSGVSAAGAVTIGAIDSVSGFLIQAVMILVITLTGLATLDLSGSSSSSSSPSSEGGGPTWLMLLAAGAVVGVIVVLVVPKLRHLAFEAVPRYRATVREKLAEGASSFRVLRHPSKLLMLFGGNLVGQVWQAVVLGLCLAAFGQHATLAELVLINTAVSLFAGFMPVPGGMGVAEAAYTACFVAIGIPSTIAMSTAIAFRLVTYYLPPIWGGFAMRWLRRHSYM